MHISHPQKFDIQPLQPHTNLFPQPPQFVPSLPVRQDSGYEDNSAMGMGITQRLETAPTRVFEANMAAPLVPATEKSVSIRACPF
jgi:hypothetical protein